MKVNRRTASRDLNPKSSEYEVTFYPTVISHEKKNWWTCGIIPSGCMSVHHLNHLTNVHDI